MRLRSAVAVGGAALLITWVTFVVTAATVPVTPKDPRIEGLSGLVVSEDGSRFTALGDRGVLVMGRLDRKDGTLVAAVAEEIVRLKNRKGDPLVGMLNDSEGLDINAKGQPVVSFEARHRVSVFDETYRERRLKKVGRPGFKGPNQGFESLALDARGRPVVIPERPFTDPTRAEILRLERGEWSIIGHLVLSDGFLPVGSDFGPDGGFYVLERRFGLAGFRSRVRRIDLIDGTDMTGQILWAPSASYGNVEGISVWRDADGVLRATMVADDNGLPVLPGGLVEIILAKPDHAG